MKKIFLVMALFLTLPAHADEQMLLTNDNQAEILTVLMILCPACVLGNIHAQVPVHKDPVKKEIAPDSQNIKAPVHAVDRNLASEVSK
jgi:hypothetical protein